MRLCFPSFMPSVPPYFTSPQSPYPPRALSPPQLRNNTVQAIGSRGSVSAQPGTVVVKESFSSQQKASKFGAVEHQIPAPDISYGIEKVKGASF